MTRTWMFSAAMALAAAAGLLAFVLVGAQPADAVRTQRVDLFFVQNAPSARLVPLGGRRFDLQLTGVGARAVFFADRPGRDTGQIATRALVGQWAPGRTFRRTPPNAALEGTLRGSGRPVTVVLELTRARRTANGVRYRARLVGRPTGDLAHYGGRTTGAPKRALGLRHASLLIDSAQGTTVNGCVIVPETVCRNANLQLANLPGVDLTGADFTGADLDQANLIGARLTAAVLPGANLDSADLANADLRFANLDSASLQDADITGANLANAVFCETIMPNGTMNNTNC